MRQIVGVLAALILTLPVARLANAQTKTVTGDTRVVTAVVEAIEASPAPSRSSCPTARTRSRSRRRK